MHDKETELEQLDFHTASKLLRKYKIPFADFGIAESRAQATEIAKKLKFPVAAKVVSEDILHKTDTGCVRSGLENENQVIHAYTDIMRNAKRHGAKNIDGVMIQKMTYGKEIIIGGKTDPQFGQVVLFGLGGIFVEVIKDVAVRIAPIKQRDALKMMKEIRGYRILTGVRGEKAVNLNKVASSIVAISRLLAQHPEIHELDLNPIFANERTCTAVDVRILVGKKSD